MVTMVVSSEVRSRISTPPPCDCFMFASQKCTHFKAGNVYATNRFHAQTKMWFKSKLSGTCVF